MRLAAPQASVLRPSRVSTPAARRVALPCAALGRSLLPCPEAARPQRRCVAARGIFGGGQTTTTSTEAKWWLADKDLWTEVHSVEEFDRVVLGAGDGQLVAVDWYATWCHACRNSYPEVCRVIREHPELGKKIKFVKICIDAMQSFAKTQGVSALPRMTVYRAGEGRLITFDIPASKIKFVHRNLTAIINAPRGKTFTLDPNGYVLPVDKSAAEEAAAAKARAIRELEAGSIYSQLSRSAAASSSAATAGSATSAATAAARTAAPAASAAAAAAAGGAPGGPLASTSGAPAWPESLNLGHMYNLDKQSFMMRYGQQYGYGGLIDKLYASEIGVRMGPNEHYLDYTGSGVYCQSQLEASFQELRSAMYGNPHSINPSSQRTSDAVEDVRVQVLKFFNADPAEYQVVFTRSATGALKMVGETFPWGKDSTFRYLRENHNSVLGIREYALQHNATFQAVSESFVERWLSGQDVGDASSADDTGSERSDDDDPSRPPTFNLFAFPAEDNFAGVKYPLNWVKRLAELSKPSNRWLSLVDAAAYVPTQPLDLSQVQPDFVDLSFYKMFGYPTGLGALLVKVELVPLLKKVFWGGGTVALATSNDNFHVLKCKPSDRLEDGTVAFLDIMAIKHGIGNLQRLGGIHKVQAHVATLTEWTYERMSSLRHSNGAPMLAVFGKHNAPNRHEVQGGIFNFEVLTPEGSVFPYKVVESEAAAAGLHVRTGTECNPGACYNYLGVKEQEVESLAGTKEGCDDNVQFITVQRPARPDQSIHSADLLKSINNQGLYLGHPAEVAMKWVQVPLGSVRASLGYMSTFEDCWVLVNWLQKTYKDRPAPPLEQ